MTGTEISLMVTNGVTAVLGIAAYARTKKLDTKKADKELTDGFVSLVNGVNQRADDCERREERLRGRLETAEGRIDELEDKLKGRV